jgi:predicted transcriptional regulator
MRTATSLPYQLFERVERLARQLNRSPTRLFSDAMREYVARHDPDAITAALDAVYAGTESNVEPLPAPRPRRRSSHRIGSL